MMRFDRFTERAQEAAQRAAEPARAMSGGAYWPRPWSCEDGGNRRLGVPEGQVGPGIRPEEGLEVTAVKDAFATDMVIRREPGELYALRHGLPLGNPLVASVEGWVEKLDPETLEVTASTPRLPAGRFWPGGIGAHENGDIYMVFGRWAHRLSPGLEVLASHSLPVDRPHNSFVLLDGGELVTKDCDAPEARHRSTVSVLDPETLMPVVPPLVLPEASIARPSSDGETVSAPEPEAQWHDVAKGDTLSAISKKFYGDANKYNAIFEANKPMLTHPDKIYPGQKLRIPKL